MKINKLNILLIGILIFLISLQFIGHASNGNIQVTVPLQTQFSKDNSKKDCSIKKKGDDIDLDIENYDGDTKNNTFIDKSYRIFYGEWIVKEICGEHERLGKQEDADELIGTKIYFDMKEIRINNVNAIDNPEYSITILPSTIDCYIPYMPSHKDLGIEGEYFTFVSVYTGVASNPLLIAASFYIKDDRTLILESSEAYYTLERVSYISDVDKYYEYF